MTKFSSDAFESHFTQSKWFLCHLESTESISLWFSVLEYSFCFWHRLLKLCLNRRHDHMIMVLIQLLLWCYKLRNKPTALNAADSVFIASLIIISLFKYKCWRLVADHLPHTSGPPHLHQRNIKPNKRGDVWKKPTILEKSHSKLIFFKLFEHFENTN